MRLPADTTIDDAIKTVVNWAETQPRWMSAALISIVKGEVDDVEITRIADLAIAEAGGSKAQPFVQVAELVDSLGAVPVVGLKQIENVVNVNRLASSEKLEFSPTGLTLIYGRNGSGKSGYTRILKQTCRVRGGSGPILPNVYAGASSVAGSADILWVADGVQGLESWNSATTGESVLRHVNMFDSVVASGSVKDAAAAPFVPYPVRLVEALGKVIVRMREYLGTEADALESALPEISGVIEGSDVAAMLDDVGKTLTVETFQEIIKLTDTEQAELAKLVSSAQLVAKSDLPSQIASLNRRLEELETIESATDLVGTFVDEDAAILAESERVKMETAEATLTASRQLLSGNTLAGIGEEAWRQMWESAREYSDFVAYPDAHFPRVGVDAVCVLCEQPLNPDAKARFTHLELFVADEAQSTLDGLREDASEWSTNANAAVSSPKLAIPLELSTFAASEDVPLDAAVKTLIDSATTLVDEFARQRSTGKPSVVKISVWDRDSAVTALAHLKTSLQGRQKELADLEDAEAQESNRVRLEALRERQIVMAETEQLATLSKQRLALALVKAAKATCTTNSATSLSGRLSEVLVTEKLRGLLAAELMALGADRLSVSVGKRTDRAVSTFQLVLTNATGSPLVGEVLSEGELRVLGLAAFFMEIRLMRSNSAIVFDDPVSSLDHMYRERVAKHLARESLNRQVIVFTHDLVFLDELAEAARLAGSTSTIAAIQSTATGSGVRSLDLPAAGGDFETQMRHIESLIVDSKAIWDTGNSDNWEPESRRIAGDLRTAWERAVEDILLFKSVSRFRSSIQTTRVRHVDVQDAHWREMEVAMTELSGKGPHDQPTATLGSPMSYLELVSAHSALRDWKVAVVVSQKAAKLRRDALVPSA